MTLLIATLLTAITPAWADDDGSDTLRHYLSKSSLVVSGEIVGLLPSISSGLGVVNYGIGLKVSKVLKGEMPKELPKPFIKPNPLAKGPEDENVFWVSLSLFDTRPLPFVKKGEPVILFLRECVNDNGKLAWQGADPWFAIQRGNIVMEQLLERAENEE